MTAEPRPGEVRAVVTGLGRATAGAQRFLRLGEQVTFGRDAAVDLRFPDQPRLSRLAGALTAIEDGVTIANLSATHDLYVRSDGETTRLAAASATAAEPAAGFLVRAGTARVSWPGADASGVEIRVRSSHRPVRSNPAPVSDSSTHHPLTLNPSTKEFAVALLLCRPRLRAVPGETATPNVPELTRQVLEATHSYYLLSTFETDAKLRSRLTGRVHEHLKSLRDKLVHAELARDGASLSAEAIADLLVGHNVLRPKHLALLDDEEWLTQQERNWEQ